MTVKDILVAYDGSDAADHMLRHVLTLAEREDAHVTGALVHGLSAIMAQLGPYASPQVEEVLYAQDAEDRARIRARFRETVGKAMTEANKAHFIDRQGPPDESLATMARLYDFVAMPVAGKGKAHFVSHPDVVVDRSGRPLLLVPEAEGASPVPKKVVIAWDGKRAASRAMTGAMPMLGAVEKLHVVEVGKPHSDFDPSVDEVVRYLGRHRLPAEAVRLQPTREGVAATILGHAHDMGADLLVMGAYEHSKIAEDLFGGVTNHVLHNANLPVLMAH
ncbi:MAG: universal stress protein [Pseudomonadota bacterium]